MLNFISKILFGWVQLLRLAEESCSRAHPKQEDEFTLVPSLVNVCSDLVCYYRNTHFGTCARDARIFNLVRESICLAGRLERSAGTS